MKQPNMKCKVCGADYYICALGIEKAPYKQIVCSAECYDKWQKAINAGKHSKKSKATVTKEEVVEEE